MNTELELSEIARLGIQASDLRSAAIEASYNSRLIPGAIPVGAAVVGNDLKLYKGCYYPGSTGYTTVHAEHAALINAVTNGVSNVLCIAIFANSESLTLPPIPCGSCLQALSDIAISNSIIITLSSTATLPKWIQYRLNELIPLPWKQKLDKAGP